MAIGVWVSAVLKNFALQLPIFYRLRSLNVSDRWFAQRVACVP